nr:hypothetical protein [Tanacetum cinerariifolium]
HCSKIAASHPQASHAIHAQSSVIHLQSSQAPDVSLQSSADPLQFDSGLVIPYFLPTNDPLECLNKALAFICTRLASSFPPNKLETSSNPMHQVAMPQRQIMSYVGNCSTDTREKVDFGLGAFIVITNELFQSDGIDLYDSNCDEGPTTQANFMANISSCDSKVLSEVPYSDTYLNDMLNQDVQEMSFSEQTHIVDFPDNKIHSNSNIIPYSQYLQESQHAGVQDTNSSAPNDLLVLSLVEKMTDQVANLDKENQTNKMVNESVTAELEIYKERVTIFEQRINAASNNREKLIDSQMDDLIRKRNTKFVAFQQEIDTLKETLSNNDLIINELKAQLQEKDTTISNLKKYIQELKGKNVADCSEFVNLVVVTALRAVDPIGLPSSTTIDQDVPSANLVVVTAPRAVDPIGLPSSTTIDQDVPSASTSPTN